ncbi:hypothetical protein HPB51_011900 [Rhipicephalus microplus]|uniref:Tumor necrosis factor receptor n=1 Tax=Rhipicephalus microplus TaxID=6941 RepID=A0A9J6E9S9_RHIMP|nr:hypothetical protein HPB51_011900 [Rhipicephalus microplus]
MRRLHDYDVMASPMDMHHGRSHSSHPAWRSSGSVGAPRCCQLSSLHCLCAFVSSCIAITRRFHDVYLGVHADGLRRFSRAATFGIHAAHATEPRLQHLRQGAVWYCAVALRPRFLRGMSRVERIDHSECPFDRMPFESDQLVRLRFEQSHLEQLSVVCTVGGRKCDTFSGKLSELKDHMRQCRSVDVECEKCRATISSEAAVEHYTQCYTESDRRSLSNNVRVQRLVEEVRSIKKDLQAFRQQSLGEQDARHDNLVNGANRLVEKLASLERALSLGREMAAMTIGEGSNRLPIRETPGPFRAASKPGLFITTCQFADVCTTRYGLTQSNKEARVSTDCSTLAGYTFKMDCKLTMSAEEDVDVSFILFLMPGVWDERVEWPFAKKVALIIAPPQMRERTLG